MQMKVQVVCFYLFIYLFFASLSGKKVNVSLRLFDIQLSFTRRHLKGPTHSMPSRRDALLPSTTFFMVDIDNFLFLLDSTCQVDLAMPYGSKNDKHILLRNEEIEEID